MSGHSKWHNIKRKKEIKDSQRSKVFSKMSRLISVAARRGGGNPDMNPTLRLAIERAKEVNMPKENIDKAVNKGSGNDPSISYEEVLYEAYGPEGVAYKIETLTDNRNRTVAELKNIFSKAGGSVGNPGSTAYIFDNDNNPMFTVTVSTEELSQKLDALEEALDEQDDVQEYYSNKLLAL